MKIPKYCFVFDVESIGLHGEAFAVGWVVMDHDGNLREHARISCNPNIAAGLPSDHEWVRDNIGPIEVTHDAPTFLRSCFWKAWLGWKESGAVLFAECLWPVEANFLRACVAEDPARRAFAGPYPFHEIASIRLAAGFDPLKTEPRLEREVPIHDPRADAFQSARLLFEAFWALGDMAKLAGNIQPK